MNSSFRTRLLTSVFTAQSKVAMEEEKADGKVSKEIEYMFYARLDNVAVLQQADSVELQEQWGLWYDKSEVTAGTGSIRVRKITPKGIGEESLVAVRSMPQYVQTIKIKTKSGDALEIPSESSEHGFNAFKILADSGMVKYRYRFNVPNSDLVWEVDMFVEPGESVKTNQPKFYPWCKIDLEVSDRSVEIPAFPEGFSDVFDSKSPDLTEEQKEIIKDMKKFLSLPNAHVQEFYKDI
jgi:hypothetical protein